MLLSLRSSDFLISIVNGSLIDLPSPSSLSYLWNYGSLLGIFLMIQIVSGLFLSFHYSSDMFLSFDVVIHMMRDINYGWIMRVLHANGASMFFLLMYIHVGRGIYYGSFRFEKTWLSGVTIMLLSMGAAFLGYVLPWGQMSFWAATVITNLLSAIPYVGTMMVEWMWGGFAVGNPTLVRFFAFHFVLPFIILFLVVLHLLFLHMSGSGNPLGLSGDCDSVVFHPYYSVKDVFGMVVFFMIYFFICFMMSYVFMDVENFISSDPLVTPVHIQPEWYFLFAYAILRSVPSSIGGVIALVMSVFVLYLFCYFYKSWFRSVSMYMYMKWVFWIIVSNWLMLTWIGASVVEIPYSIMGMYFSVCYFFMFFMLWVVYEIQDVILFMNK